MEKEFYDKLEEAREAIAKLTSDREVFKNIIEALDKRDVKRFQGILKELDLLQFCIPVCRLICWMECHVRCELRCDWVCRRPPM